MPKKLLKLHSMTQNIIIYKTIVDLGIHHDTRCEKYCKISSRFKVQGSLLFVTYTIIQGIISSEMLVRTGPLNGKCKKIKIIIG